MSTDFFEMSRGAIHRRVKLVVGPMSNFHVTRHRAGV